MKKKLLLLCSLGMLVMGTMPVWADTQAEIRIQELLKQIRDGQGAGGGGGGGDASAAKQDTGNASLGSIDTKLSSQGTAANQTAVQANAGSDATKSMAVQGVTGGKALPVSVATVPSHAVTQGGTWTMQPGNTANTTAWKVILDASSPGVTTLGQAVMSASTPVVLASDQSPIPITLPALTRFRNTAVTNTAVAVKASAGNIYGWNIINANTSPVYIKFYDIASGGVTVGTSTVILTVAVPASGAFYVRPDLVSQQAFATAISLSAVTGLADNSTTAPSSAVHVSVMYQ